MSDNESIFQPEYDYWKKRTVLENDAKWSMTFNEMCEDGVIRSVTIHPYKVSNIKRPDQLADGVYYHRECKFGNVYSKFGINGGFCGGTLVTQDNREILIFESFGRVMSAIGAMMTACESELAATIIQPADLERRGACFNHGARD